MSKAAQIVGSILTDLKKEEAFAAWWRSLSDEKEARIWGSLMNIVDEHVKKRKPIRYAKPKAPTSTPMTPELAKDIRDYAKRHPEASYMTMGEFFNVNIGRISESLRGLR